MYFSLYLYPVAKKNIPEFLQIQREVAQIYQRCGALNDQTYRAANLKEKYGCTPFTGKIDLKKDEELDEELFVSMSCFRDRAHHDTTMAEVDQDRQISELYSAISRIYDFPVNWVIAGLVSGLAEALSAGTAGALVYKQK